MLNLSSTRARPKLSPTNEFAQIIIRGHLGARAAGDCGTPRRCGAERQHRVQAPSGHGDVSLVAAPRDAPNVSRARCDGPGDAGPARAVACHAPRGSPRLLEALPAFLRAGSDVLGSLRRGNPRARLSIAWAVRVSRHDRATVDQADARLRAIGWRASCKCKAEPLLQTVAFQLLVQRAQADAELGGCRFAIAGNRQQGSLDGLPFQLRQ